MQNSIFEWVRDHRVHHKYTDTDADPHNSTRGFFFSHIGWLLVHKHPEVIAKGRALPLDDVRRDSVVMFQHRSALSRFPLCKRLYLLDQLVHVCKNLMMLLSLRRIDLAARISACFTF